MDIFNTAIENLVYIDSTTDCFYSCYNDIYYYLTADHDGNNLKILNTCDELDIDSNPMSFTEHHYTADGNLRLSVIQQKVSGKAIRYDTGTGKFLLDTCPTLPIVESTSPFLLLVGGGSQEACFTDIENVISLAYQDNILTAYSDPTRTPWNYSQDQLENKSSIISWKRNVLQQN